MSWISGLADKAENILNKIDKNAANALQISSISIPDEFSPTADVSSLQMESNTAFVSSIELINQSFSSPKNSVKSGSFQKITPDLKESSSHLNSNLRTSSRRSSISSQPESVTIDINIASEERSQRVQETSTSKTRSATIEPSTDQETTAFKITLADVTSERNDIKELSRDNSVRLKILHNELPTKVSTGYVHSISEFATQIKETEPQCLDLNRYAALQTKGNLTKEPKSKIGKKREALDSFDVPAVSHTLQSELNALKKEHQHLFEENHNLVVQLEDYKQDLAYIQKKYEETLTTMRVNDEALRKDMRIEKEHNLQLESEIRLVNQELTTLRQKLSNQMAASATRLQEKERIIEQLKTQGDLRSTTNTSSSDSRIKSLTQALVDKQNSVENITADRNALRLQLEKIQDQLQKIRCNNNSNEGGRNPLSHLNSTDDVKAQLPRLMKENPFDNRVARRVKRAYSTLDSAGIRLGVFLRRYPLIRIFVLMYVALLHIWVMFVLLSSTPT